MTTETITPTHAAFCMPAGERRAEAEGMNAAKITEMVEAQIQAREAGSVVA